MRGHEWKARLSESVRRCSVMRRRAEPPLANSPLAVTNWCGDPTAPRIQLHILTFWYLPCFHLEPNLLATAASMERPECMWHNLWLKYSMCVFQGIWSEMIHHGLWCQIIHRDSSCFAEMQLYTDNGISSCCNRQDWCWEEVTGRPLYDVLTEQEEERGIVNWAVGEFCISFLPSTFLSSQQWFPAHSPLSTSPQSSA